MTYDPNLAHHLFFKYLFEHGLAVRLLIACGYFHATAMELCSREGHCPAPGARSVECLALCESAVQCCARGS